MQSRKHENFNKGSPGPRLRAHHRFESGADLYSSSSRRSSMRGEAPGDQSVRRSLSPRGFPQDAGLSRRADPVERRDYDWHLGGGGRGDRVRQRSRSRSPLMPFGDVRKRPHFDEGFGVLRRNYSPQALPPTALVPLELHHRHELDEPGKYSVNDDSNGRRVYGSEQNDLRIGKEELNESRLSVGGGTHGTLSQNTMHMEDSGVGGSKSSLVQDNTVLGTYWPAPDPRPVTTPGKSEGHLPSSSQSMNIRHFDQERLHYLDSVALDRLPVTESYKGEKPVFPSRDGSYPVMSGAYSKDFLGSSSAGIRSEFQDPYRGGRPLPSLDDSQLSDSLNINAYRQRPLADYSRDPDSGKRNLEFYQRCSPTRAEHDDYYYPKSRGMPVDDRGYPSDELHKMMPPQRSQLDYDYTQTVYDQRNLSRPGIMNPDMDRMDDTEDSSGNSRKGNMLYHRTLQRQSLSDYPNISRISEASNHGAEYLCSGRAHVDFGRRMPQDYEISHFSASEDCQISHLKADYGFERNVSMKYQDRLSPVSKYESEMRRHTNGMQIMREEHGIYEPSERVPKRNYVIEEDMKTHNPRTIMYGKWTSREFQDVYDNGEEWNDGDVGSLYTSASAGFDRNRYIKAERVYVGLDRQKEYVSDDWLPSQHSHAQRQSVRFYKHGDRYIKGQRKPGPLSRHKLHHADFKSGTHKQHRVWKRNDNYLEDVHGGDGDDADPSENGLSSAGPEPPEDSEEFMQMVHEAFLKFSKKLNMNTAVQRRYKEQGKAGTLFCIVCGRSLSKEFMDTQRLVTHAFMSHKVGLRAQHLGLLKAICVLLGWSTVIPSDTVTYIPQVLPKPEALAQKEDLILWPPVIIVHNISMSDNNPESWKVVTIESLEAFLRGKGLIRGRIKMCLGKPADQSILVVKFLGTFTGLGDAERIQTYFAEHKRGRVDFERATSCNGKIMEAGMQGDNVVEQLLYGYMGIVEDLDKVDFHSRNWSMVKSKKEIQDLADAPVKPDER